MSTTQAPTAHPNATAAVANRLVELCNTGRYHEAMQELYADNARHVEAMEMPGSPYKRITEGKANLIKMSEHWGRTTTVHSASCGPALVNGDQFICQMSMDCTSSEGPMAGQRMQVTEQCLYTVVNGKITEAKFFYPGCG
jgi:hypothetical protein